jgi:hypothetical protein
LTLEIEERGNDDKGQRHHKLRERSADDF